MNALLIFVGLFSSFVVFGFIGALRLILGGTRMVAVLDKACR